MKNREEFIELAKQLATPIDFQNLEKQGLIKKQGAWYRVKNINALPEYARRQVRAIKSGPSGECFVQFPKTWARAQRLYRRMAGE